jgi:hypothetical protein
MSRLEAKPESTDARAPPTAALRLGGACRFSAPPHVGKESTRFSFAPMGATVGVGRLGRRVRRQRGGHHPCRLSCVLWDR